MNTDSMESAGEKPEDAHNNQLCTEKNEVAIILHL